MSMKRSQYGFRRKLSQSASMTLITQAGCLCLVVVAGMSAGMGMVTMTTSIISYSFTGRKTHAATRDGDAGESTLIAEKELATTSSKTAELDEMMLHLCTSGELVDDIDSFPRGFLVLPSKTYSGRGNEDESSSLNNNAISGDVSDGRYIVGSSRYLVLTIFR